MGVRNEAVNLSLRDDGFTTTAAKVAAVMALVDKTLDDVNGSAVRADRSTSRLGATNGGLAQTAVQSRRASAEIDQFSGRLRLLVEGATVLGPAMIPIGAVGIPALMGLTAGLGAAAGAVGTAVMAFNGLGDALGALNDYQLEPTDANLEKVQQTVGRLGPAAKDLVFRLDELGPALQRLQRISQNQMFPGVNEGLDDMVRLLPEVRNIVRSISGTVGDLAAATGDALANDPDWQAFFSYLQTDAAPTLDDFARATGNFVAGLGSLLVAFRPLSEDFSEGLLGMSRGFREWAAGLSQTDGFRDFVDYIQQNGPAVGEFFAATADAIVALITAMAPWGATVLPILTDTARIFAAIAESPIGSVIFEAAAAMLVLNRATSAFAGIAPRVSGGMTSIRTGVAGMRADLAVMASSWATAGARSQREAARMAAAQDRVKGSLSQLGGAARTAAGVGGMLLMVDGMSRAHTAMGKLETAAGAAATGFSVGGPWGAAIGGGIGLLLSFGQANSAAAADVEALKATLDEQTGAITTNSRAWAVKKLEDEGALQAAERLGLNLSTVTDAALGNAQALEQVRAALTAIDEQSRDDSEGGWISLGSEDAQELLMLLDNTNGVLDEAQGKWRRESVALGAAAGATRELTGAQKYAELVTGRTTEEIEAQAKSLQESRKAARETAASIFNLGDSLNDSAVSLNGWLRELEKNAEALRNFRRNSQEAADRGVRAGLIDALQEAGDQGARRMAQLANATDEQIARANRAWQRGQNEIRAYVRMDVPTKTIDINNNPALNAIGQVRSDLAHLSDRHLTIWVTERHRDAAAASRGPGVVGTSPRKRADGGPVYGPGGPRDDAILARLSNREWVMPVAAVDHYGEDFMRAVQLRRFADGGSPSDTGSTQLGGLGDPRFSARELGVRFATLPVKELRDLADTVDDLTKNRLIKLGKALEKATDIQERQTAARKRDLDAVKDQRSGLISDITSSLTRDLWAGGTGSVFAQQFAPGSIAGANAALRQQINDAMAFNEVTGQLKARGVNGPALQAILSQGIDVARMAASASDADLSTYQQLYGQAQAFTAQAATAGGAAVFGAEIAKLTRAYDKQVAESKEIKQELRQLRAEERQRHKEAQQTRENQATETGKVIRGEAAKGKRDQRGAGV